MHSTLLALAPGVRLATDRPYPERADDPTPWHDRIALALLRTAGAPWRRWRGGDPARRSGIVELTDRHDAALRRLDDSALRRRARELRLLLRAQGLQREAVAECFAIVREAASRTLGKRHYATQLMAGWALVEGRLVEMATGEGKTFAATLAATTVAMTGQPVHVITVNDYLAARDAREMAPLYGWFGLTVGTIVQGMPRPERRATYARDIVYCSNKELAFDYLRDRVAAHGRSSAMHAALSRLHAGAASPATADPPPDTLVLRGLAYAIVDEADSVFIDEARTPLILSTMTDEPEEAQHCIDALAFARTLEEGSDFVIDTFRRSAVLSEEGRRRLDVFADSRSGWWPSARVREERIAQALSALKLFHRDSHYVVVDEKVQIVDESTGRVMPDRSWESGLHQLIEAKEGVPLTARRDTLARLTYQRLLRRYLRLSGMTGTATEVAREIADVYGLDVERIPLQRPSRRERWPATVCASAAEKWQRVAAQAHRLAVVEGRPVLIGTRSVRASEEIAAVLGSTGLECALLNAKHDDREADVIARAGERGRITVATNMAGRGTDIRLEEGVPELGGLHVILTEHHESPRIDRQLYGRCARQHDRGSCEAIVALDDEIYRVCAPTAARLLLRLQARGAGRSLPAWTYGALTWLAQRAAEARSRRVRMQTMKNDLRLHRVLAFSGRPE